MISRIGDDAGKLPDEVRAGVPGIAWDEIRANRVLVAHIYHRIDYAIVGEALTRDIPRLEEELERWRSRAFERETRTGKTIERDSGPDLGF